MRKVKMKLRNKKTGEIKELPDGFFCGDNLKKICEEWEDYEEDNYYYAITSIKADNGITKMKNIHNDMTAFDKSIGNYFKTKEEAELAVRKLKAWKRLKDKGIEFYGWRRNQTGTYELYMRWEDRIPRSYEVKKDLNLLYGGEE